ncbi:hypothetical protein ACJIZ3_013193 [Penstemon smallii]|uniref:Pentatricopeptide repeat-containing protein n=1 Tax=Penstemon smallii TaxID=265156 RepID=A0ABD3URA1_9LAMI
MKLVSVSSSSSLNFRAYDLYQKIQTQLLRTLPTRKDSIYRRMSPLGDPKKSVVPVLDQWIREGNSTYKGELQRIIKELASYKRFKHALEVSLWMTNKRHLPVSPFDVSVRLKLIFKVFGLKEVEDYFSKIPENLLDYPVYLALLNCYTISRSVDKAESIMWKIRDLGYGTKPVWYNLMMDMHLRLGNREEMTGLLTEMERKGICHDQFTYSVCLNARVMASDAGGMDKIVRKMESDRKNIIHWRTYVIAAEGYLKMGLIDKALAMLNKLEGQLSTSKENSTLYVLILKLYAETGKKDELYRIWNVYKSNEKVMNKVYFGMMRSLMKFDDVEGMEKILEEWESSGLVYDFRVPNFLIDTYCSDGRLEKAEALISKGISKGGDASVTTWCHLAGGYLKRNELPKVVEALEKAISVCPPRFKSRKESVITCLKYVEEGESMEKVEELIKFLRTESLSKEIILEEHDENMNGKFIIEDEEDKREGKF